MKKAELKKIINSCINEVLIESGLISKIVSEVMKGVLPIINESASTRPPSQLQQQHQPVVAREYVEPKNIHPSEAFARRMAENAGPLVEQKATPNPIADMLIGGVPVFEGIKPIQAERPAGTPQQGALRDTDPNDPGISLAAFGFGNK